MRCLCGRRMVKVVSGGSKYECKTPFIGEPVSINDNKPINGRVFRVDGCKYPISCPKMVIGGYETIEGRFYTMVHEYEINGIPDKGFTFVEVLHSVMVWDEDPI